MGLQASSRGLSLKALLCPVAKQATVDSKCSPSWASVRGISLVMVGVSGGECGGPPAGPRSRRTAWRHGGASLHAQLSPHRVWSHPLCAAQGAHRKEKRGASFSRLALPEAGRQLCHPLTQQAAQTQRGAECPSYSCMCLPCQPEGSEGRDPLVPLCTVRGHSLGEGP